MDKKKVSVVIPCYRSAKTIGDVVKETLDVLEQSGRFEYEVILVNDGSPDDTYAVIKALAQNNSHVIAINLAKNFGQHSALMAGYSRVTGDYVLGLDDDGEHDPKDMFKLIDKLEEGYDYVCARFSKRKDHSVVQNAGSRVNAFMATHLIGKPKGAILSSYYVERRFVTDEIAKCKSRFPYISGILLSITHNMASVDIEHHERAGGKSGYSLKKSLGLWLNGFTAFSVVPLRVATVVGGIVALAGFIYGLVIIIRKLITPSFLAGYASMMAGLFFIGGLIMIMLGLLGEYIGRIYINMNGKPQYVIREEVSQKDETDRTSSQ